MSVSLRQTAGMKAASICVILSSLCFFLTLSFVIHEMIDHMSLFSVMENERHQHVHFFASVLIAMAVSGFAMMALMIGIFNHLRKINRQREELYQKISRQMKAIEAARDGISILDSDGVFTYMNTAHAVCYGYGSTDELIGKSWRVLYDPERLQSFEYGVFPQLHAQGWWFGSSSGIRKDGDLFPQEVSLNLLDDGGLVCTVRDVSDTARRDRLLHIIELAVEGASEGIGIIDQDNRFVYVNKSFLSLHGYDLSEREAILGTDWRAVYNAEGQDHINATVLPTVILKGAWSGTILVMKKDQTIFNGEASLTKMKDGLIVGVIRDISARVKSEKEGKELREKLFHTQKMEAIMRLTAGMATDFERFLSEIERSAREISGSAGEGLKHQAQNILTACAKSFELVEQLQAFSSAKKIQIGTIDIKDNIAGLEEAILAKIPENIDFVYTVKPQCTAIFGHSAKVAQVLMNVCLNAIDAMGSRKGKLALTVKDSDHGLSGLQSIIIVDQVPDRPAASSVKLARLRDKHYAMTGFLLRGRKYLQVSVSDNGSGINPDCLSSIFDPFFTTKKACGAAGLGLSTVQGLMIGGNGAIIVETVIDAGTTVHLYFPLAEAQERADDLKIAS